MRRPVLALALLLAAQAASAARGGRERETPAATVSNDLSFGSGPFVGDALELSLHAVPDRLDLDVGYAVTTDPVFGFRHTITGGAEIYSGEFYGDAELFLSPKATSDSRESGRVSHASWGTAGARGAFSWRPYLGTGSTPRLLFELDLGYANVSVAESLTRGSRTISYSGGSFGQYEIGWRLGVNLASGTSMRVRGAAFLYDKSADEVAQLVLPRGSFGADTGVPTRPQLFDLRASVRQALDRATSLSFTLGYTGYLQSQGHLVFGGARLSRQLSSALYGYAGLTLQADTGEADTATYVIGSLGVEVDF